MMIYLTAFMLFLGACGEDNDQDSLPNILTGVSGFILVVLLVWWLIGRSRS